MSRARPHHGLSNDLRNENLDVILFSSDTRQHPQQANPQKTEPAALPAWATHSLSFFPYSFLRGKGLPFLSSKSPFYSPFFLLLPSASYLHTTTPQHPLPLPLLRTSSILIGTWTCNPFTIWRENKTTTLVTPKTPISKQKEDYFMASIESSLSLFGTSCYSSSSITSITSPLHCYWEGELLSFFLFSYSFLFVEI